MTKRVNSLLLAGLLVSIFLTGFGLSSCKKEVNKNNQATAQPDPRSVAPPGGTITIGSSCGENISCTLISTSPNVPRYNKVTFSKNSHTIIDYPTLRYSIYKYKSGPTLGVSTYKKIAEFTCTSNSIVYANSLLDNGISHYLTLTLPSNVQPPDSTTLNSNGFDLSNSFAFTTDNYKGTYCGEAPPSGK